jgi:hypothetical protein
MTRRAWAAVAVLGVLVAVLVVAAIRLLPAKHHSSATKAKSTSDTSSGQQAPSAPGSNSSQPNDGDPGTSANTDNGDDVLTGGDIGAAHQVMVSYLQSLGSYTSADRQTSWQKAALAFTDGNSAIRSFTQLPSGKAWASCLQTHCSSQSTARVIRDTATTNVAGSGGNPQVVSYLDLATTLRSQGAKADTEHTQFTVTATQTDNGWKVSGCTFAGVGDSGANGDGS